MHFLAGWIALGCGLTNLLGRKGTSGHKALGLLFVFGVGLVCFNAFTRYRRTDLFEGVTCLAILSVLLTLWALLPFIRRLPGWVVRHAQRMQGAYIALVAAAVDEMLRVGSIRWIPDQAPASWLSSAAATILVVLAGWWLARRQRPEIQRVTKRFERHLAPKSDGLAQR